MASSDSYFVLSNIICVLVFNIMAIDTALTASKEICCEMSQPSPINFMPFSSLLSNSNANNYNERVLG